MKPRATSLRMYNETIGNYVFASCSLYCQSCATVDVPFANLKYVYPRIVHQVKHPKHFTIAVNACIRLRTCLLWRLGLV